MDKEKQQALVYEWLEKFSFEELSAQQRQKVLQLMPESHYQAMHQSLEKAKEEFETAQEPLLPPEMKEKIAEKLTKTSKIKSILNYSVPIYQVAAVFVLFFGLLALFFRPTGEKQTVYLRQTDTVFVRQTDTVRLLAYDSLQPAHTSQPTASPKQPTVSEKKQEKSRREVSEKQEENTESDKKPMLGFASLSVSDLEKVERSAAGYSLAEDSMLTRFRVTVN